MDPGRLPRLSERSRYAQHRDFPVLGEFGHREPDLLARWFADDRAHPLLILKSDTPAGFALVVRPVNVASGKPTIDYRMSEFFVLAKYRRLGIGRDAAQLILNRFSGQWEVTEYLQQCRRGAFLAQRHCNVYTWPIHGANHRRRGAAGVPVDQQPGSARRREALVRRLLHMLVALLGSTAATAQTPADIARCTAIDSDSERLKCYDKLFVPSASQPQEQNKTAATIACRSAGRCRNTCRPR